MARSKGAAIARAYDHIIVGGGSAGSVLAARLSERDSCRVLMIEAGGADFDRPAMVKPRLWQANWGGDADWFYRTVPQANLDGRIIDWTRGKVVGGSSTINAMARVWGHPADFDNWSRKGNVGWDFDSLKPVFMRMESCTRSGHKIARGTVGPMALFSCSTTDPLVAAFLSSCRELGHAVLDDVNEPVEDGAGTGDVNIKDGRRFSVVHAYLLPVLGRSNLIFLTKSLVESLIFEGTRCIGVRCRSDGITGSPRRHPTIRLRYGPSSGGPSAAIDTRSGHARWVSGYERWLTLCWGCGEFPISGSPTIQ